MSNILTANAVPLRRIEDVKAANELSGGDFFRRNAYANPIVFRGENSAFFVVRDTVPELEESRYIVYRLWADGNRDGFKPGTIHRVSVRRNFRKQAAALSAASLAAMCDTDTPLCFMNLSHMSVEDANWKVITEAISLEYDPDGIPGKHPAAKPDDHDVEMAISFIQEFLDGSLVFEDGDLIYSPAMPVQFAFMCAICACISMYGLDGCEPCMDLPQCRHEAAVSDYTKRWRVFIPRNGEESDTEACAACGDSPQEYGNLEARTIRVELEVRD